MRSTVVAAIDSSAAAWPVLEVASAFARATGSSVQALHVAEDGDEAAATLAASRAAPLRTVTGNVIQRLCDAAAASDVIAIVLGGRGRPGGPRPAGHVALKVMTRVDKAVIVVPPDAAHPAQLQRVLVPAEGRPDGTHALAPLLERLAESGMQVTALHVDDDSTLPSYSDQPQHETEVFSREFVARNLPPTINAELALRVGKPGSEVLEACDDTTADLVAVAWSRNLSPGRARVVRQLLEQSHIPVLLVPEAAPVEPHGRLPRGGRAQQQP